MWKLWNLTEIKYSNMFLLLFWISEFLLKIIAKFLKTCSLKKFFPLKNFFYTKCCILWAKICSGHSFSQGYSNNSLLRQIRMWKIFKDCHTAHQKLSLGWILNKKEGTGQEKIFTSPRDVISISKRSLSFIAQWGQEATLFPVGKLQEWYSSGLGARCSPWQV